MNYKTVMEVTGLDLEETNLKPVAACTDRDILACDVFTPDGRKLLCANTAMNEYLRQHLRLQGIDCVQVHAAVPKEEAAFSRELVREYKTSVGLIRRVFIDLSSGKTADQTAIYELAERMMRQNSINGILSINKLMNRIQQADAYTYYHSVNVALYSMFLARWRGLSEETVKKACLAGLLHDFGKTRISKRILQKPGPLSASEYAQMKRHPADGYRLLLDFAGLDSDVKEGVLLHHERMDASGYPLGVTPQNELARIIAVTDVYDAMTSDRVYKKRSTPFYAFHFFLTQGQTLFDWRLTRAFISNMAALLTGTDVELQKGERAKIVYVPPESPEKLILAVLENGEKEYVCEPFTAVAAICD